MQPNIIKSSMFNGLIMGVLFSTNFLFSVSKNSVLQFLTNFIIILILVVIYKMTLRYRDVDCEGEIKYGKAFSFILLTFFFAAIISSIVKYIYFEFFNPNYLVELTGETMKVIEAMKIKVPEKSMEIMEKTLKPASFALQYIWVNTLAGALVGLIMALFIKKEKSIFSNQ
jgi:hypothetical protein